MLSEYQLQITEDQIFGKIKNIILNLGNKRKYKIYYQNLKLYLNLGLQSKKYYRILEFKKRTIFKII